MALFRSPTAFRVRDIWHGSGHTSGLFWVLAATLYYGTQRAGRGVFTW